MTLAPPSPHTHTRRDLLNCSGAAQWGRRCNLVTGAKDGRSNTLLERAEAQEPRSRRGMGAPQLSQLACANLLMSTETGAETHPMVDNQPGKNGLEAWNTLAWRFDPASPPASLNPMSEALKPLQGQTQQISFFIGNAGGRSNAQTLGHHHGHVPGRVGLDWDKSEQGACDAPL